MLTLTDPFNYFDFNMETSLTLALYARPTHLIWIETFLFSVMNVAAFNGNLFVCYAVYRNRRLRTIPNIFVIALAASDILMSTFCVPFSVVALARGHWIFGESFCQFHGFGVFTFGLASLHTMGIIAISRYFCVVKPDKYVVLFKTRKTMTYIAVVWGAALLGSVPPFFFENGGFEFQPGKALCLYTFQTNIVYTAFIETVYVATPFVFIIICYVKVFYTVSSTNRIFSAKTNLHTLRANIEEARVTKTLGAVMVGFAFCWLPVCIIDYIDAVYRVPTLPRQVYLTYAFLIYLSSTINPFIYGATNRHFRRESKVILRKVFCLKSS